MIPAEAVEASAKYLSEFLSDYPGDYSQEAREILEAAAPHMLAGGAQEAVDEMAKVIATHHLVDNDACDCNEMFYDTRLSAAQIVIEHGLHIAMELHNAGYGSPTL